LDYFLNKPAIERRDVMSERKLTGGKEAIAKTYLIFAQEVAQEAT
jgi:hypothetical protein